MNGRPGEGVGRINMIIDFVGTKFFGAHNAERADSGYGSGSGGDNDKSKFQASDFC